MCYVKLDVMCLFSVLVLRECPRLCGSGRDQLLSLERELSQFVRALMVLVYPSRVVPAAFDVAALLDPSTRAAGTVDEAEYLNLFGPFFQFSLTAQMPFFFKSVQNFFRGLVEAMTVELREGWPAQLSFTPFDAIMVYAGSEDRRIDALCFEAA